MQRLKLQRSDVDSSELCSLQRSEDGREAESSRRDPAWHSPCIAFACAGVQADGGDDRAGVRGWGYEVVSAHGSGPEGRLEPGRVHAGVRDGPFAGYPYGAVA